MLQEDDTAAVNVVKKLTKYVGEGRGLLDQMSRQINVYEFDEAKQTLAALFRALKIDPGVGADPDHGQGNRM